MKTIFAVLRVFMVVASAPAASPKEQGKGEASALEFKGLRVK